MSPSQRALALADQLRARRSWYAKLADLAREQLALIDGDAEGLADLVERKRAVMAELERLAAGAPAIRQEWEALRRELAGAEAAPVEAELAATAKVLEEVVRAEEEARRRAESARAAVSEEMKAAVESRRAAAAYGRAPGKSEARFVDRKE